MRTDVGGGQATARRRRRSVGAEISIPSDGASRSLTSALVAKPSATSASRRRLVMRAYDCTRSGSLSVKIWRGQAGVAQTHWRTERRKMTRRPAQGRSATVLPECPCTRSEGGFQRGQAAQKRRQAICTTNSLVVVRTDETTMLSGRENKREAVSKSPIDEILCHVATPQFIDGSLSENHTAVQASRLTFFKDEPLS